MTPAEIIQRKMSNEGFPIPRKRLVLMALGRLKHQADWTFQYGDVLFTVSKDKREAHLYAFNSGVQLFSAFGKFMREVWNTIGPGYMIAPVMNKTVERLMQRFGWQPIGRLPSGHRLYMVRRDS